jgi:hypothetical protein
MADPSPYTIWSSSRLYRGFLFEETPKCPEINKRSVKIQQEKIKI